MATASIRMDGFATPNDNYSFGNTVSLSNADDTGVSSWLWTLEAIPGGSGAVLSDASAQFPTFTVDVEGSYRISLSVNGGAKDYAVARIRTQHVGLKALAHDETSEADPTEGWALPWRESYLAIDKRIGLGDYRTVYYQGPSVTGPRVLYVLGTYTLPNGDLIPMVDLMQTPSTVGVGSRALFLWEGLSALDTGDIVRALSRGMSAPIVNPQYYIGNVVGYTFGIQQFSQLYASGDPDVFPNPEAGGFSFRETFSGPFEGIPAGVPIGNEYYLGTCVFSASDGSGLINVWWDPTTNNSQEGHGFHNFEGDGNSHPAATEIFLGFMQPVDVQKLGALRPDNIVHNGAFDFWQRGTTPVDLNENLAPGQFTTDRVYFADRWYALGLNNNNSISNFDITAEWSQRSTAGDPFAPTEDPHPYCVRINNQSTNTGDGTFVYGANYFAVQEIDREVVKDLATKTLSALVRVRKGPDFPDTGQVWIGVGYGFGEATGTLSQYFFGSNNTQNLAQGFTLLTDQWQTFVFVPGVVPANVTAASIFVYSTYDLFNNGGPGDYVEFSNVVLMSGTFSTQDTFIHAGGSRDTDRVKCMKYFETSYERNTAPATNTQSGLNSGIVTLAQSRVAPAVRFRESKATGSVGFIKLFSPTGTGDSVELAFEATDVLAQAVSISSEGFVVSLDANYTAGGEALLHYTASFDI